MLIKEADPEVVEEVKWRKPSNNMAGVPVWSHDGILCTGETYKDKVKLTFAQGASLPDPCASSTPASKATRDGRSTFMRATRSMRRRSRRAVKAAVAQNASPVKKAQTGAKKPRR